MRCKLLVFGELDVCLLPAVAEVLPSTCVADVCLMLAVLEVCCPVLVLLAIRCWLLATLQP